MRPGRSIRALILCGGQGLRLKGNFGDTPKPLIVVRGKPLVAHIIDHYRSFGVSNFVLLVGDKEDAFHEFARSYSNALSRVEILQTGRSTPTGGRLSRALAVVGHDSFVLATYGDGISDVDIYALLEQHEASGKAVTLTAVSPTLPYGLLELGGEGEVCSFVEKPIMEQWTNGGYFVISREVLEGMPPDCDFEAQILPALALEGRLGAYQHRGFWKSMDTYKDYMEISSVTMVTQKG